MQRCAPSAPVLSATSSSICVPEPPLDSLIPAHSRRRHNPQPLATTPALLLPIRHHFRSACPTVSTNLTLNYRLHILSPSMQHTPALFLYLIGSTPALPLDSLSAILACLYNPCKCLNCGIPMIRCSALDAPSMLSPVAPLFFLSLAHTTQTIQMMQMIHAWHCRYARCTDESDQGTEVRWLSSCAHASPASSVLLECCPYSMSPLIVFLF